MIYRVSTAVLVGMQSSLLAIEICPAWSLHPLFPWGSCMCSNYFQKYWASSDCALGAWESGLQSSGSCDHLPVYHQQFSSCTRSNTFSSSKGNKEQVLNKKLSCLGLEVSLWGSDCAVFLQPKIYRLEENYREACWKARKRSWLLRTCCCPLLLIIRTSNK